MNKHVHQLKRFCDRNGATILTVLGGAGVVATSVMAVKATPKALMRIEAAKEEKGEELTKLETAKVAAPVYIPTVLVGASTLVCIFGANVLSKRQQANLVGAYALLDRSFKEYKNKVTDMLGVDGANEIRGEIAKDKYREADNITVSPDNQLFYDEFSGQYFETTMEKVLWAENQINRDLHLQGGAVLADWYSMLDIPEYDDGGLLGWSEGGNQSRYWQSWIDFNHHKVVMEDGLECIIITMDQDPYLEFDI